MEKSDIPALLHQGIAAAKAAQQMDSHASLPSDTGPITKADLKQQARDLLTQVIDLDSSNVQAWLWLSTVLDSVEDKITCFENVLFLDPKNQYAETSLRQLRQYLAESSHPSARATVISDQSEPAYSGNSEQPPYEWANDPQPTSPYPEPERAPEDGPPPHRARPEKCPFCEKSIFSMDMVCPHCEVPLVMDCPACNTLMDVEWPTCKRCGFEMGDYKLGSVYFTQLATGYRKYDRIPKAVAAIRVAEKMDPDQPDLYRLMGEIQAEAHHPIEGIATLQKAIEQEPEQMGPYLSLGKVLQQEGRWEQAERVYNEALRVMPNSSEAYAALGDLFMQRGQYRKALRNLRQATKINPKNGAAWGRLGELFEATHRTQLAARAFHQATLWLPPDLPEWDRAEERLKILDPRLSRTSGKAWPEFIQQLALPILISILAVFLDAAVRSWQLNITSWMALPLAILGAFLWVSATALPQNPLIRWLMGQPQGLAGSRAKPWIAGLGAFFWLAAMGIIILPLIFLAF